MHLYNFFVCGPKKFLSRIDDDAVVNELRGAIVIMHNSLIVHRADYIYVTANISVVSVLDGAYKFNT